jgi:uncharacterized membrane protein YbaN (DUF454 family)
MPVTTNRIKKWVLISLGTLAAFMGVVGIFFPVLPTTPFLLLAAICYTRSSEYLYRKLLSNRLCGSYLRNYLEGRGMTAKAKALTLTLLWVTLIAAAVLFTSSPVIRIILASVGIGVTVHLLMVRTLQQKNRVAKPGTERCTLKDP